MTEKKLNRSTDSRSPLDCGCADVNDTLSVVNLSGGKDSSALLLLMIERGMPIDSVLWANTGMDFPEMAAHIDKLDEHLYQERGLRITRLQYPHSFEWLMLERPLVKQSAIDTRIAYGQTPTGYGWPRASVRWCTGHLKTDLLEKEATRLKKLHGRQVIHYIGIAADEAKRCREGKRYPLVEWGITEADALQICYDRGYDFGGLYQIYRRASCWCCPMQRISELRSLRQHHPELWARLLDMDNRARAQFGPTPLGQFKEGWSVAGLDARFAKEDAGK